MLLEVNFDDEKDLLTVFKRIWIDATMEQIQNLKEDHSLMELKVKVCEECYLEITDNLGSNGINKFTKGEKFSIHK